MSKYLWVTLSLNLIRMTMPKKMNRTHMVCYTKDKDEWPNFYPLDKFLNWNLRLCPVCILQNFPTSLSWEMCLQNIKASECCQAKAKTKAKESLLALLSFNSNSYSRRRRPAGRQEKSNWTNMITLLLQVSNMNISNVEFWIEIFQFWIEIYQKLKFFNSE